MTLQDDTEGLEALLRYLQTTRGFDVDAYKRPSLTRRVMKRIEELRIDSFASYLDQLEAEPDEFERLFNTILINVTSFFRDPDAWRRLAGEVIPRITAGDQPVRVWVPGCASGEEVYTIAILLAEALGPQVFSQRVKVYATDVDEEAMLAARQARYSEKDLATVPEQHRKEYFEPHLGGFVFRPDLRRAIIFGRHDLLRDPPMSRLDLISCRNTLMYFNADAQAQVLSRFHFALKPQGFLFLGRAEMLMSRRDRFVPVDLKHRIFARAPSERAARPPARVPAGPLDEEGVASLLESALEVSPAAQIVVDRAGIVVGANRRARRFFDLRPADVGRPLQDLDVSYRPLEIRSRIDEAYEQGRPVHAGSVERARPDNGTQVLEVQVAPLFDAAGEMRGATVTYTDVTPSRQIQAELEKAKQELESTNEELQSTVEELETTNEELQSTVEELETTNEELQATNEELETMNEELQSANAELQTMNDELQQRTLELDSATTFLESIMSSVPLGVAVLDDTLRVVRWSGRMEDLWGLHAAEVAGVPFEDLDIGFPVRDLVPLLQACLRGEAPAEADLGARNRRGKPVSCHVTCAPLAAGGRVGGVVLLMEEREA